jgi:AcrR family transcriptional regulator
MPGGGEAVVAAEGGSDLSQRIMRAAKELFFARGFADTSLRSIATAAGTSESGVLRLFQSKTGLLRAVYASCWAETNDHVDRALAAALADDPDPRNLLVQLVRSVLERYQADPAMMTFMLSHFGFRDTSGLGDDRAIDPVIDQHVRDEYHRYLYRIHDLCADVARVRPELGRAGVTPLALGHVLTSITYGIQAGWYMAEQEHGATVPDVTMEEALAAVRFYLYPEKSTGQ